MLRLTTLLALVMSLVSVQAHGFEKTMDNVDREAIQCSDYSNQILAKGAAAAPAKDESEQKALNVNTTI